MTEQELREMIAEAGVNLCAPPNMWKRLKENEKDCWRKWAKERIIPLISGYILTKERK